MPAYLASQIHASAHDGTGGLASTLSSILAPPARDSATAINVLELGAGCGLVGIALAQQRPNTRVVLTDLPEAMEILAQNISSAQPAPHSSLRGGVLTWGCDPLNPLFDGTGCNVVLVSDCTYNADSQPALVRTLLNVVALFPDVCIVVAMKRRHASEDAFFGLLKGGGLAVLKHDTVTLPDASAEATGSELEVVHIFQYRKATLLDGKDSTRYVKLE